MSDIPLDQNKILIICYLIINYVDSHTLLNHFPNIDLDYFQSIGSIGHVSTYVSY